MFVHHPKMARRWAAHTPKGKKLPDHVDEMPHVESDVDVGGKTLNIVDLRIEKYPVNQEEKKRLMRAFTKVGLVGDFHGQLLHFRPDHTIEVIDQSLARQLPRLPHGWDKIMTFVSEGKKEGNDGSIPENPHLPDPEETGREFVKTGTTYAVQLDQPFVVSTIENDEAEAKAGDFLCKGPKGDMWPVDREVFLQTYKPADTPKMEKVFKRK